jgi:RecA-family ATPase
MTFAQDITRHFGGDWAGSQGAFPSPGHSPKDRGITVKDAPDGDVIFYCHNDTGFDWRAFKDQCRDLGLLPPREQSSGATWRETGHYEYVGADGLVAYRTVRLEKQGERKRFKAEHPNGRGGWAPKIDGIPRVLYRLPDILAADPATPIYLVEGERKADKLASWSLVATAVAFGAKGWRKEYAEALKGRTVIILPDNDDEGRGLADRAKADIIAQGGKATAVELPGLPHKGDIINWTGTAEDLAKLTSEALNPPAETLPLADLTAWAQTAPTPKTFILERLIPQHEVVILTGDGGTNKSTLGLQIAACRAAGKSFLGLDLQPGVSLYATAEDDDRENHWRLTEMCAAIGTSLKEIAGRLHVSSLRGRLNNELATFDTDGRLRTTPAFAALRNTIIATAANLIILDNVAHLFAGNENDRGQVTAFINLLYQLCRDLDVTVLLIAHRNKNGDTYSGSTAWLNAVRSQILMERPEGLDADARQITLGKANYARQGEAITGVRWHDFALIRDDDLPADQRAELAANLLAATENESFMRCLASATEAKRAVSHNPGSNYAPKVFTAMPEGKHLPEKAYARAMERLISLGHIQLDRELWRGPNRVMKQGIKASETAPTPLHAPPAPTCTKPAEILHASAPLDTTYQSGAPLGAGAPFREEKRSIDFSRFARRSEPVDFATDEEDPAADAILRGEA